MSKCALQHPGSPAPRCSFMQTIQGVWSELTNYSDLTEPYWMTHGISLRCWNFQTSHEEGWTICFISCCSNRLKTLFHHPLPHRESVERSMQMSNPKTSQRSQDPLTGPPLCNSGLRRLLKFGRKSKTPVWWQPTALTAWYARHPTALIALHVGNLQHSKPCTLATCSPHGPVCSTSSPHSLVCGAPYSPHSPVCWPPTAHKAWYVGNLQPSWPCMLATYSPHGPVCWQPTAHTHVQMVENVWKDI